MCARRARELGGAPLTRLFSFACGAPFVAERLLHTLLVADRWHNRVHPSTGRPLTEYFAVRDDKALRALVHATVRYVNALKACL